MLDTMCSWSLYLCRYTDQDYDSEFIEVLQTQCANFIKQEGEVTLEEVSSFIHEKVCNLCACLLPGCFGSVSLMLPEAHSVSMEDDLTLAQVRHRQTLACIGIQSACMLVRRLFMQGISKIHLRDEDVMQILETLEFDGRVDRIDNDDGDSFRQAMLAIPETSAFTSIPCGVCPVSSTFCAERFASACCFCLVQKLLVVGYPACAHAGVQ